MQSYRQFMSLIRRRESENIADTIPFHFDISRMGKSRLKFLNGKNTGYPLWLTRFLVKIFPVISKSLGSKFFPKLWTSQFAKSVFLYARRSLSLDTIRDLSAKRREDTRKKRTSTPPNPRPAAAGIPAVRASPLSRHEDERRGRESTKRRTRTQ